MANYTFVRESAFVRATGDRDWHAHISVPHTEPFEEMDMSVAVRGETTARFFAYAIKSGIRAQERWFSFNFKDGGDIPFDGTGDDILLTCTLHYPVPK